MIKKILLFIISLIIGALNGLFGGGGGMIAVPLLEKGYNENIKIAHATALLVILPITLASGFVYFFNLKMDYILLIELIFSVTIGGAIGAILLKKIPPFITAYIFSIIAILAGIKMVFFS